MWIIELGEIRWMHGDTEVAKKVIRGSECSNDHFWLIGVIRTRQSQPHGFQSIIASVVGCLIVWKILLLL